MGGARSWPRGWGSKPGNRGAKTLSMGWSIAGPPMKISTNHFKRYGQIASLLWKYGRSDLVRQPDLLGALPPEIKNGAAGNPAPEQLADDLEAMGSTYIKLGQVLAGRPDLLPEPYLNALARLQDRVKPFPYDEVEQIVTTELGVRISKAFSRFEAEPLAAASLGQVHLAALRDGRPVVVKVQRPNIRLQIAEDFEVLEEIAGFLDDHTETGRRHRFRLVLEEFRTALQHELDYEQEAQNLIAIGENLREFDLIRVPQPVASYSTRSVLTMDYVRGQKVTALGPLAKLDAERTALVNQLFAAYLKQVLIDGVFHADPHPGNVLLTEDGRIALIDLGMVGHVTPGMQEKLFKLLLAVSDGKSDEAADLIINISEKLDGFDAADFRRRAGHLLAPRRNGSLQQLGVGRSLVVLSHDAARAGLFVPGELTLLGKTLLQLDGVGRALDSGFDPNAAVRRNATELMLRRVLHSATKGSLIGAALDSKNLVSQLPLKFDRILDSIANAELELKVKAVDAKVVLDGMQKIANRITVGLILASLIVGASLLMRVPTRFQLFGYPGLAALCFLGATAGGLWLLFNIFSHDQKKLRKELR